MTYKLVRTFVAIHPKVRLTTGVVSSSWRTTGGAGSLQHEVGSATELVGEDGESLSLAALGLEAVLVPLSFGVVAEEADGGFGKGPLEMGVSDLGSGVASRQTPWRT